MSDKMNDANGGPARSADRACVLKIYPRLLRETATSCTLVVPKDATAASVIQDARATLGLDSSKLYELVEVRDPGRAELVLDEWDLPMERVMLWPPGAHGQHPKSEGYYFHLQERAGDGRAPPVGKQAAERQLAGRGFLSPQREQREFDDLCQLPILTEANILDNLRARFHCNKIYTYAGSLLVVVNPFKFLPIYNPKYVRMYDNHRLGQLPPHIFAVADVAYYTMLRKRANQCIVISGESGSGKTQSTNFLIHCLTALSQKGYASGVERTILGAGPVLEAFGNAKTAHNDNSSRFGKFIQVNYLESGVVRGAVVEKYLLEKCRLVSREQNERNYHVFYYLLVGATEEERRDFKLLQPEDYFYLKQQNLCIEDEANLRHEFKRLQQAMEMVGFLPATKKQIFSVLSAILYLGNVTYKSTDTDGSLEVGPPEVLATLSDLLQVKKELLVEALTRRKAVTVNDTIILPYSHSEAITARDSMAKSLYGALFDWIVLRINHSLLNKKDMEESVPCLSIGVLDIFGFEDFRTNSFEQFCINYANEQLQYYFNQYVFRLEQEEYLAEGIPWNNIDYTDNVGCIHLISKKPTGLFYLLDEESNFPHATEQTLLAKFKQQHHGNRFFLDTPVMEPAFVIRHFAGKVKYQIKDFRAKNTDHMRHDIVALLRGSSRVFVRQLVGMDPVALFRWGVIRAAIRIVANFNKAGKSRAAKNAGLVRRGSRTPIGELRKLSFPKVERMQSRSSLIDFSFDRSEERPLEVLEDIFASYESRKGMRARIMGTVSDLQWSREDRQRLIQSLVYLRYTRQHSQKNRGSRHKQLIPKNLLNARSLKFILGRTLHDRTTKSLLHLHTKKKTPSISAQFQVSLSKLLETLGKAEPFFISCIRSNAEKKEMCFDEALVLQQLRYTGMLETVRIRRSGYSAKYTFQEFTEQFRALLPINATDTQRDIAALLQKMGLNRTTYQIGKTKVFLKEPQRQQLLEKLHREVMGRIVFLQRWFRARLERRHFLRMREAAITIQRSWRSLQQENRYRAATMIQAAWRGSQQRADFLKQRASIIKMQAMVRASSARRRYRSLREEEASRRQKQEEEAGQKGAEQEGEREVGKGDGGSPAARGGDGAGTKGTTDPAGDGARPPALRKTSTSGSQDKKELHRQLSMDQTAEGTQPPATGGTQPSPEQGSREHEKKEGDVPPPLRRPATLPEFPPLDEEPPSPQYTGCLQRYSKQSGIKDKAVRWRERRSEGAFLDSRPNPGCLTDKRTKVLMNQGLSMSLDNVSKYSSSESDSSGPSPVTDQDRVRLRKHPKTKRKRRLAYARSGLMFNKSAEMEDMEYWTFPLPPISPGGPLISSARSPPSPTGPDAPPSKPRVQFKTSTETTPNGSKVNTLGRRSNESSGHQSSSQSQPTTPEKPGFLRRILKKRTHKEARTPEDGELTMAQTLADGGVHGTYSSYTPRPNSGRIARNPTIRISRATRVSMQWNASLEREITNTNELRHLDEFLGNQVNDLRSRGKQLSGTENIFLTATMAFRETIKGMYSLSKPQVGYKGLMNNYKNMVASLAGQKQKTEVQLVVNLFQSVLDGFIRGEMKREEAEPSKPSKKQKKERMKSKCENILDHMFSTYQVNIMQSCDQCSSYIWGMEKAFMCCSCKMVCHKKCLSKISTDCSSVCAKRNEEDCNSHFGVRVCLLISNSNPVPVIMEKLLGHVEMNGLYTEGIYRKSGSASRARELHQLLENEPLKVSLDEYPIHTIAGLVKQWLRELPDPLMTFTHYNDFLRAVELPEQTEKLRAVYKVLDRLPSANFNTLERLIFHLVRVAKEETHNRMSPNSLAIVFAPCLLRSPDTSNPFLSMNDVGKTTMCVEILINEQFRRYSEKMGEIEQLEFAEALAINELKLRRQNTVLEKAPAAPEHIPADSYNEERSLIERIKSIKQEKDELAYRLPELEQPSSDQENLDMDMSMSCESLFGPRFGDLNVEGKVNPCSKNQNVTSRPKTEDLAQGVSAQPGSSSQGKAAASAEVQQCDGTTRNPCPRGNLNPIPEKREEQPGRRKGGVQSLYITSDQDPTSNASQLNRPLSEANIPYIDEEV